MTSASLPVMRSDTYWSYYKTRLRPAKFGLGLGLVRYEIGVEKFQVAYRWQLRTTQCSRTPTNVRVCLAHTAMQVLKICSAQPCTNGHTSRQEKGRGKGRNENLRKKRKEKDGRDGINISSEINFWLWPGPWLSLSFTLCASRRRFRCYSIARTAAYITHSFTCNLDSLSRRFVH